MAAERTRTLLEPGRQAEWAEINRVHGQQEREFARSLSPAQRIERGQRLSQQAVALLAASIRAGHVPARAFWS